MSIPESFYREAIDLNRYTNRVAREIVTNYNNVILDLTNKLATIDEVTAPATVARIRSMLLQMKESLEGWSVEGTAYLTDQMQSLALFQNDFVVNELQKALPIGAANVNSVQISGDFARSIVYTDPTEINILTLPSDLESQVKRTFNLTAAKGSAITLPNGQVVEKAFRGIAAEQAEFISREIRVGITEGESISKIARRLRGKLQFGENQVMTAKAQTLAGGTGTKLANNQNLLLVDTKYEFGKTKDGKIVLIDEIHTPDSSRYFYLDGYTERQMKNEPQKQLSKEFLRQWLISNNFQGLEGQNVPNMSDEYVKSVSDRYIELYENITSEIFVKSDLNNIKNYK